MTATVRCPCTLAGVRIEPRLRSSCTATPRGARGSGAWRTRPRSERRRRAGVRIAFGSEQEASPVLRIAQSSER